MFCPKCGLAQTVRDAEGDGPMCECDPYEPDQDPYKYLKENPMSKSQRDREARKRKEKRKEKNSKISPDRIVTQTIPCSGKLVIIGMVDGKVVYSSKPLSPTYAGVRRQRWVNRITKRIASRNQ